MQQRVYQSDVEGNRAICFDTGLDPRSFARTKMSQSLIEPGHIVLSDGSREVWKAAGVHEINGNICIWGPSFAGKRLDLLFNEINSEEQREITLRAAVFWIRAKMLLGETDSALNPGAAFICLEDDSKYPKGSVFFAPKSLSNRCLLLEGTEIDCFNCPDLTGMEAAAFCAGTMLYKIFIKSSPYPDNKTIYQDMREGVFLPPHLAVPELDKKLCSLIQSALMLPPETGNTGESGTEIIGNLLSLLIDNENNIVSVSSLFSQLSKDEYILLEKEKKKHLFKQSVYIKIKRLIKNNKIAVMGVIAGLLIIIFTVTSMSNNMRPTTAGMNADDVVITYYEAFSSLDYTLMEACIQGADKIDIDAATNLFAIYKVRQVYEMSTRLSLVPAKKWQESGGELPSPDVFGITDLSVQYLDGSYEDNMMMYRAEYLVWAPNLDYALNRSDTITLKRDRKNNWRITEILREER